MLTPAITPVIKLAAKPPADSVAKRARFGGNISITRKFDLIEFEHRLNQLEYPYVRVIDRVGQERLIIQYFYTKEDKLNNRNPVNIIAYTKVNKDGTAYAFLPGKTDEGGIHSMQDAIFCTLLSSWFHGVQREYSDDGTQNHPIHKEVAEVASRRGWEKGQDPANYDFYLGVAEDTFSRSAHQDAIKGAEPQQDQEPGSGPSADRAINDSSAENEERNSDNMGES